MSKLKRIGWAGFVNDKPYFENTNDPYSIGSETTPIADIFKTKTEAQKRFEDIGEVFIKDGK